MGGVVMVSEQIGGGHKGAWAQLVKNRPTVQETQVHPWVGKIPWRRKWQPTPVFLPGKIL